MARSLTYKQRFQGYWRILFKRSCKLWFVSKVATCNNIIASNFTNRMPKDGTGR